MLIETPVFTRLVCRLLPDEDYRELQNLLVKDPEAGQIIKGSGGLRKIRWGLSGKGKRGGVRVIYYWFKEPDKMLFLYLYKKNVQADLTSGQLKILKTAVEEELS